MLNWMAWTLPTAIFFATIAGILLTMTILEVYRPCRERKGFLPLTTTRGDRLFISLLTSAFIHLTMLGATDLSIWVAFAISIVAMTIILRWG